MITTVIIQQEERGLVYRDGRLVRFLEPGRHNLWRLFGTLTVKRLALSQHWAPWTPELDAVLPSGAAERLEVAPGEVAALTADGHPVGVMKPGRYLLWQLRAKVEATLYSTEGRFCELPPAFWQWCDRGDFLDLSVEPHRRALLYVNGILQEALEGGRYLVCMQDRQVTVGWVDMREAELQVAGQEVITADKASLRINLVLKYRVVDALRAHEATQGLRDALYSQLQMVARGYVGGHSVDQLLENREGARTAMIEALRARAKAWGVEILEADLKDVVLPGDMKLIHNQVLAAQKQAQAKVILRREEIAATRSQANTARMMANNQALMRLKEMEVMAEIASKVGQITVVTSGAEGLGALFGASGAGV